jgi:hypothetical protein
MSNTTLDFMINFSDPATVSQDNRQPDSIAIEFKS